MDFNEYQALAIRTAPQMASDLALAVGGLGLTGESGEAADLIKKVVGHGHERNTAWYLRVIEELGDVMWYLAFLAQTLDADLDTIVAMNVEKLRRRYPDGFDAEVSRARAADQGSPTSDRVTSGGAPGVGS